MEYLNCAASAHIPWQPEGLLVLFAYHACTQHLKTLFSIPTCCLTFFLVLHSWNSVLVVLRTCCTPISGLIHTVHWLENVTSGVISCCCCCCCFLLHGHSSCEHTECLHDSAVPTDVEELLVCYKYQLKTKRVAVPWIMSHQGLSFWQRLVANEACHTAETTCWCAKRL